MAAGKQLSQIPPAARKAEELVRPEWQRWLALLGETIKSLISADQLNQFAAGTAGAGCYSTPVRAAATDYTTGTSPRFVSVMLTVAAGGDGGSLTVGGSIVSKQIIGAAGAGTVTVCAVVPAGTVYRLTLAGGAVIGSWVEL